MLGDVYNVVTCAKFHVEIFSGCNFTEVEFSMFVLIFAWALQQFSANTSGSKDQRSTSQETEVVFGHLAEASFSTSLGRAVFLLPILCSIVYTGTIFAASVEQFAGHSSTDYQLWTV